MEKNNLFLFICRIMTHLNLNYEENLKSMVRLRTLLSYKMLIQISQEVMPSLSMNMNEICIVSSYNQTYLSIYSSLPQSKSSSFIRYIYDNVKLIKKNMINEITKNLRYGKIFISPPKFSIMNCNSIFSSPMFME